MATVYKAYEPALDRHVAIKVLHQHLVHDPDFTTRFEREAKAVAKLDHPNILPIYSYGQEAGLNYISMRYVVEARTLKELLKQPLNLRTATDILRQICQALDYAHQQGIVHRDVKPANVLVVEGKRALLSDFSLALMIESSVQLNKCDVGMGTPAYMSPEQGALRGGDAHGCGAQAHLRAFASAKGGEPAPPGANRTGDLESPGQGPSGSLPDSR